MIKKKRILFYSSVSSVDLFNTQKFYQTDISILTQLGFLVIPTNRIIDSLKFWRYDIIFSYFYRYSFFPSIMARLLLKKVYFTGGIDDLDSDYASKRRYIIQKVFFSLCYLVSSSCIIVSNADLKNISLFFKFNKKLSFSEHTIDTYRFSKRIRKEPFFTTIAWLGDEENVYRKGINKALVVFKELKKLPKYQHYKFYIIGKEGAGTQYVKSLMRKYDITDSVYLLGEISENLKIEILKQSEYYFQLSVYEGFGIAALEALCANCILIHSGKGGLSNPIYSSQILFNIDNDFSTEFDLLIHHLNSYSYEVNPSELLEAYDNKRRADDFKCIICENKINYKFILNT